MPEFIDNIKNALDVAEDEMKQHKISTSKRTISNVLDAKDVDKMIAYFKDNKDFEEQTSDEFVRGINYILMHMKDYLNVHNEL